VAGCELGGGKKREPAFGQAGGSGEREGGGVAGDLEPLPLAPLPRPLPVGVLPAPLGVPLAGDCLPLDLLPLPFAGEGMGGVTGAGWGTSRKASVTRNSQSSSRRGMKAAMRVSWTSASMYPSESCRSGTSWGRVTVSDEESGDERPRSRWRSKDCRRWSAVVAAGLRSKGSVDDVQILRRRSLMIWTRETLRFLARRTIVPHWLDER
jgi:hypothetical protein